VQVQVRVEDGHGGRLKEEDELDPDLKNVKKKVKIGSRLFL